VYVYSPGTTTDKVSYTVPAATGGTENTQPVVLNARGEANIYVVGDCKITVTDSLDNLIYTLDNVRDLEYDLAALSTSLAASSGSSLVGFIQSGTGAVATTVQAKLRESISVFDFMTAAQIADVQAGTLLIDVTAAIQSAIDWVIYKHTRSRNFRWRSFFTSRRIPYIRYYSFGIRRGISYRHY
jgi:hypothetical protein